MEFIDLFAGLGGFHVALKSLGHQCVFASEIDETLRKLYRINFGMEICGDIKEIREDDIPSHDILCAGFPCQPFSKAGEQKGLKDKKRGNHFIDDIVRILNYHKPKYFILENVPNLEKHDKAKTWRLFNKILREELEYDIRLGILSPHDIGVPQIRDRLFIVGSTASLDNFSFPSSQRDSDMDIRGILDKRPSDSIRLDKRRLKCLSVWNRLINSIPASIKLPSPIWSMEFGATYPYEDKTPHSANTRELKKCKGVFGKSLKRMEKLKMKENLPSYARENIKKFPEWKQEFIRENRKFYEANKKLLKPFISELKKFPSSWQKLEWNCLDGERNIYNYVLQFRASGIRVKRTTYAPSLVLTKTQLPIVGWEKRYITVKEAARLQSLDSIRMPEDQNKALRALGNAVNAKVVRLIASMLIAENRDASISRAFQKMPSVESYPLVDVPKIS